MGSFEEKLIRRVKWKILGFITQFKVEFLLLFTGCRKVVGKMPRDFKWKKMPDESLSHLLSHLIPL